MIPSYTGFYYSIVVEFAVHSYKAQATIYIHIINFSRCDLLGGFWISKLLVHTQPADSTLSRRHSSAKHDGNTSKISTLWQLWHNTDRCAVSTCTIPGCATGGNWCLSDELSERKFSESSGRLGQDSECRGCLRLQEERFNTRRQRQKARALD